MTVMHRDTFRVLLLYQPSSKASVLLPLEMMIRYLVAIDSYSRSSVTIRVFDELSNVKIEFNE